MINVIFTFAVANISSPGTSAAWWSAAVVAAILAYAPRERRNLIQAVGCALVLIVLLVLTIFRTAALLA